MFEKLGLKYVLATAWVALAVFLGLPMLPTAIAFESKDCVTLFKPEPRGKLGQYVDFEGASHKVHFWGDSRRGWDFDFELKWTAPPQKICVGDRFTIKLEAINHGEPQEDRLLTRAAFVGMTTSSSASITVHCDNPAPFSPKASAWLAPHEKRRENRCDLEVTGLPRRGRPYGLIFINLAMVGHSGQVSYLYQPE
jgi:hypothetical protein